MCAPDHLTEFGSGTVSPVWVCGLEDVVEAAPYLGPYSPKK